MKEADDVNVTIFDLQGRKVQQYDLGRQNPGTHEFTIDGTSFAPSMYVAKITSEKSDAGYYVRLLKH